MITTKAYRLAQSNLTAMSNQYDGCKFGATAKERLKQLLNNPAIQQTILDADADDLEKQALASEQKKNYVQAKAQYEQYIVKFRKATRFPEVSRHFTNPAFQPLVNQQIMNEACQRLWLRYEMFIRADKSELAIQQLGNIIKTYPQSDWASKAKQELSRISRTGDDSDLGFLAKRALAQLTK